MGDSDSPRKLRETVSRSYATENKVLDAIGEEVCNGNTTQLKLYGSFGMTMTAHYFFFKNLIYTFKKYLVNLSSVH